MLSHLAFHKAKSVSEATDHAGKWLSIGHQHNMFFFSRLVSGRPLLPPLVLMPLLYSRSPLGRAA